MKKLLVLTIALSYCLGLFAQNPWSDRTKYRYTYDVHMGDNYYEFSVVVTQDDENGLAFDWTMTLDEGKSGSIYMSPAAVESATDQHNYFTDGTAMELEDATSVWLSNQAYKLIMNDEAVTLNTGSGEKTFVASGTNEYHLDIDGQHTHAMAKTLKSEDGTEQIDVLAASDYNNPLIMGMIFPEWSIFLSEIEKL